MIAFKKVVRLGTMPGLQASIFCEIKYTPDMRLSITGVEGPRPGGNAVGGCGQIVLGGFEVEHLAPGWEKETLARFKQVWEDWHLNDMQAGTPKQTAFLKEQESDWEAYRSDKERWGDDRYPSHYTWAQEVLGRAGLNPDPDIHKDLWTCAAGYEYGHRWLKVVVPEDVLEFLAGLPDTDTTPAWV